MKTKTNETSVNTDSHCEEVSLDSESTKTTTYKSSPY